MAMTVDEFWSDMGPMRFVDKVAHVLGIKPDRIVVVDVVSGSTIVSYTIEEDEVIDECDREAELELVS